MTKAKTIKMPMNDTDKRAAFALVECTLITDRQRITLYKLVYMHRRQIADQQLIAICKPFYDAEQ